MEQRKKGRKNMRSKNKPRKIREHKASGRMNIKGEAEIEQRVITWSKGQGSAEQILPCGKMEACYLKKLYMGWSGSKIPDTEWKPSTEYHIRKLL